MDSTQDYGTDWRKSERSNGQGACVEVGHVRSRVAVRDTTQHGRGPLLAFTPEDWRRFTTELRSK